MAELVAILATTHHPFYYATSKLPGGGPAVRRGGGARGRGVRGDPARGRARCAGDGREGLSRERWLEYMRRCRGGGAAMGGASS